MPQLVTCQDESDQAEFLIREILQRREEGIDLRRQAVLYRTSHHSVLLEGELTRRNIPYVKFGGLKFLEAAHIKDLLVAAPAWPRTRATWSPASACCNCCPASAPNGLGS